jgi:hypothetical protein
MLAVVMYRYAPFFIMIFFIMRFIDAYPAAAFHGYSAVIE